MKTQELKVLTLDEMEELLKQTTWEKLVQKAWLLRNKLFGRPPTFVSKEGVHYYRGPQEVLMSAHHEQERREFLEWKLDPKRLGELGNGVDPLAAERSLEEKQKRELAWARERDNQYQVPNS